MRGALLLLIALCACSRGDSGAVLLWHTYNGAELEALEDAVAAIERDTGIDVALVSVPYEAFADKLTNAIPNGNGPDLFIYAHDRLGHWVSGGLVEPIEFYVDEALADRFAHDAIASLAHDGSLYGLPLAVKSIALYHRTDLVPEPPRTTAELYAIAAALRASSPGTYALAYENTTLYGHAPWLHGHGASVFDDAGAVRVATPEASRALAFARDLDRDGIVPSGVDGRMVATLFNEGVAAMALSGPWFASDLEEGVPWAVTTLPTVSATGLEARPFLGTEGVLLSARARDTGRAFRVMEALTGDASAATRARTGRQVVPNHAAYALAGLEDDPLLRAFRAQLERSVPMPATPAMRAVWTPYQTALLEVIDRDAEPADALRTAAREIASFSGAAP